MIQYLKKFKKFCVTKKSLMAHQSEVMDIMHRGIFDFIKKERAYSDSQKNWYVSLEQNMCVWFDLVVSSYDICDFRELIKAKIKDFKRSVKDNIDKRFIYFICSRKKIRFSLINDAILFDKNRKTKVFLEIGRDRILKEVSIDTPLSNSGNISSVEILELGKVISFKYSRGPKLAFPVHDFLLQFSVNLDISTEVHYVGLTDNPESRPLYDGHTGFNEILYKIPNDDQDVFVYFNLFKVLSIAENSEYNFQFNIANSMIDEINADKEGSILEKCFIFYFDSKNQYRNKKSEKSDIENRLKELIKNNNINDIQINYEVDDDSEYYHFFSSKIESNVHHRFTCKLKNETLNIENGSTLYDLYIKPYEDIIDRYQ
jgi:hypothetical protein